MSLLTRIRLWCSSHGQAPELAPPTVICGDLGVSQYGWMGGFEIKDQLRWNEVGAVLAYKRDCLMIDQIRVALADLSGLVRIDISEEDAGYRMLIDELPRRLDGCLAPEEWFTRVAFPAFATNMTELYRRPGADLPPTASAP